MTGGLPAQARLSLTGRLLQFNCTVFLVLAAIVVVFFISAGNANPIIANVGSAVAGICFVGFIAFVIWYYGKQSSRPADAQRASLSLQVHDQKILVQNPPDTFFEAKQINTVLRAMLVGFDEELCPDGEVIGDAADGNYRRLSKEEQAEFQRVHEIEIRQMRRKAAALLKVEPVLGTKEPTTPPAASSAEQKAERL